MNKYYLCKKILENPELTAELKNNTQKNALFPILLSDQELYNERVDIIEGCIFAAVKEIPTLTGMGANQLIQQKDAIMNLLRNSWNCVRILLELGHTFQNVLESRLDVTLEHILGYEKAEQLLTRERDVTVLLDGNKTHLSVNGENVLLHTMVSNSNVDIEKCRDIVKKLEQYNCFPEEMKILLSVYTQTKGNECGDLPEECLLSRTAHYDIREDRLLIYENDRPVHENNHGIICDDPITLADAYC